MLNILKRTAFVYLLLLLLATPSWAAHPLITDDTGTQSKGNFQLEVNGQYDWDKENIDGTCIKSAGIEIGSTLSYGILENVDLVLSVPFLWSKAKENDAKVYDENGIGDVVFETKWRIFEKNGFSLGIKPGITIPTGNYKKGLGTGQLGGHFFLMASQELGSWAFHGNAGYIRNENKNEERKDLWHASVAATWEAIKDLKLVANIGIERNPDDATSNNPAFLIGGFIYSLTENFDVDLGVKCGLSRSETDISLMTGIAYRF